MLTVVWQLLALNWPVNGQEQELIRKETLEETTGGLSGRDLAFAIGERDRPGRRSRRPTGCFFGGECFRPEAENGGRDARAPGETAVF